MKMDIIINTHLAIKIYAILVWYRKKVILYEPRFNPKMSLWLSEVITFHQPGGSYNGSTFSYVRCPKIDC